MSKQGRHIAARQAFRPGEGSAYLDILGPRAGVEQGHGIVHFGLNLATAPVPDRRYVADVASVTQQDSVIKLLFGQQKVDGRTLRSLLVIHMDKGSIEQIAHGLETMQPQTLNEYAKANDVVPQPLTTISEEPSQTIAFTANMAICAVSGALACIDVYVMSAFALLAAPSQGKIAVDPVVRVELPVSVLLGVYRRFKELVA